MARLSGNRGHVWETTYDGVRSRVRECVRPIVFRRARTCVCEEGSVHERRAVSARAVQSFAVCITDVIKITEVKAAMHNA